MQLRLNEDLEIQASQVTDEQICVVVDDFLLNPGEAVEYALSLIHI